MQHTKALSLSCCMYALQEQALASGHMHSRGLLGQERCARVQVAALHAGTGPPTFFLLPSLSKPMASRSLSMSAFFLLLILTSPLMTARMKRALLSMRIASASALCTMHSAQQHEQGHHTDAVLDVHTPMLRSTYFYQASSHNHSWAAGK